MLRRLALLALPTLFTACGSDGACEGYSAFLDETFCYDGWTREECEDYDDQEVNGANWTFLAGEDCGYGSSSSSSSY